MVGTVFLTESPVSALALRICGTFSMAILRIGNILANSHQIGVRLIRLTANDIKYNVINDPCRAMLGWAIGLWLFVLGICTNFSRAVDLATALILAAIPHAIIFIAAYIAWNLEQFEFNARIDCLVIERDGWIGVWTSL